MSRFPGYPVQEWISALVWRGGPLALNALTALFCVASVVMLLGLLRRLGLRDAALAAIALAFIPVVYIGSVSAMDYLWALTFLLAAFRAALEGRALRSGLWLGVAVGCRMTSCVFLLPCLVLLLRGPKPVRLPRALAAAALATLLGVAWYVPAFLRYGTEFLSYSEPGGEQRSVFAFLGGILKPSPAPFSLALILGQGTVLVWGLLGCMAIALAVLAAPLVRRGGRSEPELQGPLPRAVMPAVALAILLEAILYFRLPHDEGYLIPALPFALIVLAAWLPRTLFRATCTALLLSSFVLGADIIPPKKGLTPLLRGPWTFERRVSGETLVLDVARGPIVMDRDKRVRTEQVIRRTLALWSPRPDAPFLMCGVLDPVMIYLVPEDRYHPRYWDHLTKAELDRRLAAGERVVYLPDLRERVERIEHYDLAQTAARPLLPDDPMSR